MAYFAALRHKLWVEKWATLEELKKAYKKASIKYHPDKNKDDKEWALKMMKKITVAYEILTDDWKMFKYEKEQREIIRNAQKAASKKKSLKKRRKKK